MVLAIKQKDKKLNGNVFNFGPNIKFNYSNYLIKKIKNVGIY